MDEVQLEGSEPVVQVNDAGDAELTWGQWTVTAWIEARTGQGDMLYSMQIDFHGDNNDGEDGMYGTLATSLLGSPKDAAEQALRSMAFRVTSLHQEDNEDDWNDHERSLNLKHLLNLAVKVFEDSMAAERLTTQVAPGVHQVETSTSVFAR